MDLKLLTGNVRFIRSPLSRSSMLKNEILDAWERSDGDVETRLLDEFLDALNEGEVRAAEKEDGEWVTNEWVKKGILLNFSERPNRRITYGDVDYHDKFELKNTDDFLEKGTRNTPDGTVVRDGCYVGDSVIMMSPSFVNIGAYVGDETLIDSCDTIGSCAQIGERVKIGANTLIGGVLEPIEDAPVVIEEGASVGGGCRITSGFVVGEDSVIAENTLLNPSIPVYDFVSGDVIYGRIPPERRVMQRYVESSIEGFDETFYKPAVVATSLGDDTLEKTQKEDALRTN